MSRIVGVHGIAQQYKGPNVIKNEWLAPLKDGLRFAGFNLGSDDDLTCPSYGNLFRPQGTKSLGERRYDADDVCDNWERDLLVEWWNEARAIEPEQVPDPEAATKSLRTPRIVQRALDALSSSKFFAGVAEWCMIGNLKQVGAYLTDAAIRNSIRNEVEKAVTEETRVLIGHSLGSVVAYECLCAHPEWKVKTFVSLGSPLGIRNLIFDRLEPQPQAGVGVWPGSVEQWYNIADAGDIVALVKRLNGPFGSRVEDRSIHNGARVHDVEPYLTAKETGYAIASGL